MTSRKNLVQTTKWSTSPKIPDGAHFHMWGQKSNAYILYIVGKETLSALILS